MKSTNGSKIVGLDMNFDKNLLYFTTEDSEALYEFNWLNSSRMNVVKNIGKPTQVAVDWSTDNVYFVDESIAIKVCHMENRKCITLIEFTDGENITSLVVDALHQRLFYSTVNVTESTTPQSAIIAYNWDGSEKQLVTKDSFFVPSITCDFYAKRVYYVGMETTTIWSVKYDGRGKQLMIAQNMFITRPIKINLFENHAYVSNAGSKSVAKCSMYGDRQCNALELYVNQPDNLVIAQKSRQKSTRNACANITCNTICTTLLSQNSYYDNCICDFGKNIGVYHTCSSMVSAYMFESNNPI